MTKSEFIKNLRGCKKCGTKHYVDYRMWVDVESLSKTYCIIKCANCGASEEGHDPVVVLAAWNAKNFDKKKDYVVVIQHKTYLSRVRVLLHRSESTEECSKEVSDAYSDYEVISVKTLKSDKDNHEITE